MSIIPLHIQRRFEQRWAARFGSLISGRIKERIERLTGQHCATCGKSQRKTRRTASARNPFCDWLNQSEGGK